MRGTTFLLMERAAALRQRPGARVRQQRATAAGGAAERRPNGATRQDPGRLAQAGSGTAPDRLLTRLAENEVVLIDACNLLTEALTADRRIAPAGEWLLDNFYLIEDQIRAAAALTEEVQPGTAAPGEWPSAGLPRVYDMALETISTAMDGWMRKASAVS